MTKLNVFISYAHEDNVIAVALSNMLQQTFGNSLPEVFLDTKSIDLGGDIGADIKEALRRADVLLVVSTGALRTSHSWPGFELGYFEASHSEQCDTPGIRGKVITICADGAVPPPVENRRYVPLSIDEDIFEETEENLENRIEIDDDDQLVTLLGDFLFETTREKLSGRRDYRDSYKNKVLEFKKAVYREFNQRIRNIRKPQKQLLVRYSSKHLDSTKQELPPDATITSIGGAIDLFNIPEEDRALTDVEAKELPLLDSRGMGSIKAKRLNWQSFRELLADNPLASHWFSALSKVVLSGGTQNMNVDNSQVIASYDRTRRYRLVLTTSSRFYSGEVEASVYLVESLLRKDYGREDTTLLLKGLYIVCRFRFVFLEPQSEFYWINVKDWKLSETPNLARQLLIELDFLHTEAKHAQLDKVGTWSIFVPLKELEIMSATWKSLETPIRALCDKAIENTGKDAELQQVVSDLAAQLQLVAEKVTPHNATVLRAMSVKLADLAGTDHDTVVGAN